MAKSSGSGKSKKTAKPVNKKKAKKKSSDALDRLLRDIQKRNQAIMKEAKKIDDIIGKARLTSAEPMAMADDCPPPMSIPPGVSG
jgi:hypothetical protein